MDRWGEGGRPGPGFGLSSIVGAGNWFMGCGRDFGGRWRRGLLDFVEVLSKKKKDNLTLVKDQLIVSQVIKASTATGHKSHQVCLLENAAILIDWLIDD